VTEKTPIVVQKNKSAIGRGLVGALAGPVGVVIGVASALTPESKIIEQETARTVMVLADGNPMLKIETTDIHRPLVELVFQNPKDAEEWYILLSQRILG
jgi:hypothetical protein